MSISDINEYLKNIDLHPRDIYSVHERLERQLPFHSHHKSQLTYVDGGMAYIYTENKVYYIPARHYIWIPAGFKHFLKVRNTATVTRNIYFYTFDEQTDPFYQKMGIFPVNTLLYEMLTYAERWSGHIGKKDPGYNFMAAVKNILPEMSTTAFPIELPTTLDAKLRPVILYLAQNYADEITLESVSHRFNIGERTLSRLFQSTMSISFLQYLKLLRVVRAIEMILNGEHTTTEIAYLTGYKSVAAFSKAFYQLTNIRPSDFGKSEKLPASPKNK